MPRCLLLLALLVVGVSPVSAAEPQSLFDGKTLDGWEGAAEMFRVEDGAIVAGTLQTKIPRNEFLCTTAEYGDFELRLKAKLVGTNAGVQFRTKRIPNHHEVSGYQCDMGPGIWGTLYDESRRNKYLTPVDAKQPQDFVKDGWNDLVIRCEGPRIQLWVNGVQTVDYTEKDAGIATKGVIALQIHSGPPAEALYKDISVVKLN